MIRSRCNWPRPWPKRGAQPAPLLRRLEQRDRHILVRQGERAVALGASVVSRYDDGVANACTNLGNVRAMRGELDDALQLWQRSAEILERRLGPDSRELADVLENVAIVHEQQGRQEQGKALCQRVADIRTKRR